MDQKWLHLLQNYLKQFVSPSLSSLIIIFGILPVAFAKRTPELAENKQNMIFFHGSIFLKL